MVMCIDILITNQVTKKWLIGSSSFATKTVTYPLCFQFKYAIWIAYFWDITLFSWGMKKSDTYFTLTTNKFTPYQLFKGI